MGNPRAGGVAEGQRMGIKDGGDPVAERSTKRGEGSNGRVGSDRE